MYEKSSVQLASVELAQPCPNKNAWWHHLSISHHHVLLPGNTVRNVVHCGVSVSKLNGVLVVYLAMFLISHIFILTELKSKKVKQPQTRVQTLQHVKKWERKHQLCKSYKQPQVNLFHQCTHHTSFVPRCGEEEKQFLVYTVCACASSPQNSVATVFVHIRMYRCMHKQCKPGTFLIPLLRTYGANIIQGRGLEM